MKDILGYLAAFCTTFAFLPQAIQVWKTKDTTSISFSMYSLFLAGICFWLMYGYLSREYPIIAANAITLIFAFSIWWMKLKNRP